MPCIGTGKLINIIHQCIQAFSLLISDDYGCLCWPFYRDTLEPEEEAAPAKERGPPPLEKMDTSDPPEETSRDNTEPPTIYMETSQAAPAEGDTGQ